MWIRVALPVYWLALVVATHYPRVRIPGEIPQSDKLIHFAAFAILAVLFWLFMAARAPSWLIGLALIAYAGLDEYTQQFVGRDTDLVDWLADVGGIVVVVGVLEARRALKRSDQRDDRR